MLDIQIMLASASKHADRGGVPGNATHDHATLGFEHHPSITLEPLEPFVRSTQKRHVVGVLEVREADRTASAVCRATVMRRRETVDPKRTDPTSREFKQRR